MQFESPYYRAPSVAYFSMIPLILLAELIAALAAFLIDRSRARLSLGIIRLPRQRMIKKQTRTSAVKGKWQNLRDILYWTNCTFLLPIVRDESPTSNGMLVETSENKIVVVFYWYQWLKKINKNEVRVSHHRKSLLIRMREYGKYGTAKVCYKNSRMNYGVIR